MKTFALVLGAATVLAAPPARADHPLELSVFAGWHIFNERNGLGAHEGVALSNVADSEGFGVRVGWQVIPRLQLEGELAYFFTEVEDQPTTPDNALVLSWRLHALFRFADVGVRNPGTFFALAGIAEHAVEASDKGLLFEEIDWSPYVGLGASVRIGKTWGLRFDGKLFFVPASDSSGRVPELEVLGGVFRTFGEKSKAKPKAPPPVEEPPATDPPPSDPPPAKPAAGGDADGDGIED
jgi:Outer membrane protein beta-barrel domain